jgi:aspartate/methionine/tyrosine aminotransferase
VEEPMKIPPYLLDEWLNQYHFASQPPQFDFASGTGPHWTLRQILGLADTSERDLLDDTEVFYSERSGSDTLRQAIAEVHGVNCDQVQIVTGASEGLMILFFLAAQRDANVILPFPLFPSTQVVPYSLGVETRYYHLRPENHFRIDLEEIDELIDNKTKLVLVNTPHNPTGATLSDRELRELHDFVSERGIQFVSDEVYHPIYHGHETSSALTLPHATVLGSVSKALGLSGLRIGWIIERDPARLRKYMNARGYFTISNSPLAERIAVIALKHRETILARTRKVTAANLSQLDQFFADYADDLGWVRPRGGMTAFPWLRDGGNAREFCRTLAEEYSVLLVPGDCFHMPAHFRLGFGVAEEGFTEGLARFADFLSVRRSKARRRTETITAV